MHARVYVAVVALRRIHRHPHVSTRWHGVPLRLLPETLVMDANSALPCGDAHGAL
jgi:hypothetical protein